MNVRFRNAAIHRSFRVWHVEGSDCATLRHLSSTAIILHLRGSYLIDF